MLRGDGRRGIEDDRGAGPEGLAARPHLRADLERPALEGYLSLISLALLLALTACGKAGSPQAPGSAFPLPYPNPALAPTAPVKATPEDQAAMLSGDGRAKFTDQGSYIDPAVRSTELMRSAVAPGAGMPYAQIHSSDQPSTPFNSGLSNQGQSPLGPVPGTTPSSADPDETPPQ